MKRDRVFIDGICVDVMHSGKPSRRSAIYFYGFPGSIGVNALTEKLVDSGVMVLQPHFPGTYDSSGKFDPFAGSAVLSAIFSDNQSVYKSVKSGKEIEIMRPTCVFGHSFGAFAALEGAHEAKGIDKLVLLAPAISFKSGDYGCGLIGEDISHYDYVQRSRPYTYRLVDKSLFEEMYLGKLEERGRSAPVSLKKIVGIVGDEDGYFDLGILSAQFESIVRRELKGNFSVRLHVASGASHSLDGLVAHPETCL